ncbi:MAG TPA: hypothetical protein PK358_03915 [Spirochaetota bacterium]|nr:hypothetical protein [Spirochaetota bacterium]HPJ33954.1 hypothetical protein [Spirochaetota bacterium]
MVYLAVLLVLTGLLIVLVALFSESGRSGSSALTGRGKGGEPRKGLDPEDVDIVIPESREKTGKRQEEDIVINFEDRGGRPAGSENGDDWGFDDRMEDELIPDSGPLEDMTDSGFYEDETGELVLPSETLAETAGALSVSAVLFNDRSNLIDYDSGGSSIGASVAAYKSIKRMGAGELLVDDDGLSFYMDDRLHRFDFHKVYDVWSGPGFVALPLKGGSSVKLFMIEGAPDFPDRVEVYFQKYTKGI